jgi:hypothetical protein
MQFTYDDETAILHLAQRFFESSHALMTAEGQIKTLITRLKAVEERFEERLRLGERKGGE